ncbi:PAS domain-containing protein [Lactobacillus sp. PV034]|uniref:PAS domain-containing protein n=1 Tax=Lactobacillus sp. PV034 TaxID=2594495 RepID=UPI0022403160|nr:PAS domain-containing protein [Lactobacillus sp. PV034]QNQ81308.1 oxidoreductase [Lactobacillus sp. PV034]
MEEELLALTHEEGNWLKKASQLKGIINNNAYIRLNAGILSVNQINELLASYPGTIFFYGSHGHFLYYKQLIDMNYDPKELGHKIIESDILATLKSGTKKEIIIPDQTNSLTRFVIDKYKGVFDKEHKFAGVVETVEDIYPLVEYYLKETGQKLVDDPTSKQGAQYHQNAETDAETGASEWEG